MEEQIRKEPPIEKKKKSITISLTKPQLVAGILALALVAFIFTGGFGFGDGTDNTFAAPQPTQAAPTNAPAPTPSAPTRIQVSTDDDPVLGDENAPVTMIEFSDFECPFCGRFYSETLPQIEEEYIDTGKVKLVYRDLPLGFHANAQKAAEAAECAGEQGKFREMHDALFDEGVSGGVDGFKQFAVEIGLDSGEFDSCLDNGDLAEEVRNDISAAQAAGASGTPSFFIGNDKDGYTKLVGAQPFAAFQQAIEAELA